MKNGRAKINPLSPRERRAREVARKFLDGGYAGGDSLKAIAAREFKGLGPPKSCYNQLRYVVAIQGDANIPEAVREWHWLGLVPTHRMMDALGENAPAVYRDLAKATTAEEARAVIRQYGGA